MIYDAGMLNKKISILGRVTKEIGGFARVVTVEKYHGISAAIRPSRGREYYEAKQATNAESVTFIIRYREGIEASDVVMYKAHNYEIQSVVNPNMENESLELYCVEKTRGKTEERKRMAVHDSERGD